MGKRYIDTCEAITMAMYYYLAMLLVSLVLLAVYAFLFHKHFDANLTILSVLVPVLNLGFWSLARSEVIEEALIALRFTYIGGCYLLVSAMFLIFNICGIRLKPWMRVGFLVVSSVVFLSTLTIGYADWFYVGKPDLAFYEGAAYITNKKYGVMHTVFYALMIVYYLLTASVIVYSFFKKKQIPRKILVLVALAVTIALIGFFGGRFITQKIEILPVSYNLGMAVYLIIASRLRMYDPSDSVIDSLVQKGETGFVSFDHRMRYLGSNETAKAMFPELSDFKVDRPISEHPFASQRLLPLIEGFEKDESQNRLLIEKGEATYLILVNRSKVGLFGKGYQFLITDDTANQKHLRLIQNYNSQLEEEVAKKTAHIQEMHNRLVLGMATMVESRDNSTGGHIRRTSEGVRILVEELKKDPSLHLEEGFCSRLIRAAPMHDLGKIAVDDAILRKPGRFTPEEFEIMKTHASEGAKIVHQILDGTDDYEFHIIAENVAHYHHERWDGSGYPCGLAGEDIPFEARVMAIADVYDALVSKRVYKDSMSFEQADAIILSGMGSQFDPSLKPFYESARPALERYYQDVSAQ